MSDIAMGALTTYFHAMQLPSKTRVSAMMFTVVVLAGTSCSKESATSPKTADMTSATINATQAVPVPAFTRLVGQWQRPDGGYILDLKSVDARGQFQAAYMNPSPINVSKAMAFRDGEETKVFVELQDANYPGCTYSLKYDSQYDQLYGEYYQAAMGQRFDVTFARFQKERR